MVAISMQEFLRTGCWGPVRLRMSRSQVQAAIGSPEAVSVKRESAIWKFGDVEFHFVQDMLFLIHIDQFDPASGVPRVGGSMQLDPWVIRQGISRAEMEQHLSAEQIPVREMPRIEPHTARLSVGAGIQLFFVEQAGDFDPPPGLAALSYSSR